MPDATREQRTTVFVKESPLSNLKQESIIKENRKQPRSLEGIEYSPALLTATFSAIPLPPRLTIARTRSSRNLNAIERVPSFRVFEIQDATPREEQHHHSISFSRPGLSWRLNRAHFQLSPKCWRPMIVSLSARLLETVTESFVAGW